ncbi:ClpP/crotonase-like domain-containing protein [Aspergillus pseudodeflectus]|uniref:ClpP/crotonase-like domain-containing protein n=1 Tax=Aspergillus pseudodeflectus TaxID=176178 RepID=A0ABR4JJX9_9EURO
MAQKEECAKLVLVETHPSGIRVCILSRPTKRNALSQALIDELLLQLRRAESDEEISCIIITGSGGMFSAGADIKEISQLDAEGAHQRRYLEDLCNGMRSVRKPVIAAVEGKALGGGFELALMADFIVATTDTSFGLPEVTIGLIPGAGGTQRLTTAIGKYRAMQMVLLNEPLSGPEALKVGLVATLTEPGHALEAALDLAKRLASQSRSAVILAKGAISDDLGQDEQYERSLYYTAFGTRDKREGVAAFLEKRPPVWKHLE